MATTQNNYTGNGSNKLFSITFPYLDTADIDVFLNGTLQTVTTQYFFANATTIEFVTAPANGAAVRLDRSTDDSALAATFFPGSSIKAADLNADFDQTLYVVQELGNQLSNKVNKSGDTMSGNLAMSGNKVTGLGTTSSATDAATKQYVDDNALLYSGSPAFTQDGVGAVPRSWSSKLKDVVSVKDFGAVGDGVANDTAAILAAINSNASFLEVYMPPGTYRLSSPLIINRQNLTLTGAGRATTLYPDAGVTAIELAQGNGVSLTVLRDFRIYGNTNATGGIALGGFFVAFCQIHNLSIENFTSFGSFGIKMSKVQELDIFNCVIMDNYNNVIFPNVVGNYATSAHIHGEAGYIGRALNIGILLEKEAASLVVSDIVIENNDAGGIAVIGKGSQVNISRVHFEANTGPNSIYVSGTAAGRAKFTVSECFFFDEPAPILRTDYVLDSVVENNVGLIGAGKIITTANSTIQFRFNRGEDVALDPDAITLYESLLGKITYTETEVTTGAIVNKVNQIRFPTTPVLSSNSSTLDDYKEGTWTPSLTCGTSGTITLSSANARYTKIGNMVTVFAVVVVSGVSSPVGELRLNGLPFAVGAYGGGTFAPFAYGLAATAITSLVGVASSATSYAVISKYSAGGVANLAQDVQNGTGIYVSFSYLI